MKRREFIKSTALIPVVVLTGIPLPVFAAVPIREDIRTFSTDPKKVAGLRLAVERIGDRPITSAASWFNMAAIHDISQRDKDVPNVPTALQELWRQCHGDESLFFLWHRAYVWSMEKLMQEAIGDSQFRLPYWDWYSDPSLPAIFRTEFVADAAGRKNPLYRKDRWDGVNDGNPVWQPELVTDFGTSVFSSFQDRLNQNEHGNIHMAIGTRSNMGNTQTAARDPIFWLHHANIDRLLPVWLAMDTGRRAPTQFPTWQSVKYRFPAPGGGINMPSESQLNLNALQGPDYVYEKTDPPSVPKAQVPKRPSAVTGTPGLARTMKLGTQAISAKRSIKVGAGATVVLPIADTQMNSLKSLGTRFPSDPKGFTSLSVILDGVSLRTVPPGVLGYRVFVELPDSASSSANFDDHFLGAINLFALGHSHMSGADDGGQQTQLRFSATEAFLQTVKRLSLTPSALNVSLLPVLAPGAKPPQTPVLEIMEVRVEASDAPVR